MAALAKDRDTEMRGAPARTHEYPVNGGSKIYAGALVCIDTDGYARPAADTASFVCVGRAAKLADNTSGADGDIMVTVDQGVFKYTTTGGSALVQGDVSRLAYVLTDNEIVKAAGTSNNVIAGQVVDFDSDGVWIDTYKKTV